MILLCMSDTLRKQACTRERSLSALCLRLIITSFHFVKRRLLDVGVYLFNPFDTGNTLLFIWIDDPVTNIVIYVGRMKHFLKNFYGLKWRISWYWRWTVDSGSWTAELYRDSNYPYAKGRKSQGQYNIIYLCMYACTNKSNCMLYWWT